MPVTVKTKPVGSIKVTSPVMTSPLTSSEDIGGLVNKWANLQAAMPPSLPPGEVNTGTGKYYWEISGVTETPAPFPPPGAVVFQESKPASVYGAWPSSPSVVLTAAQKKVNALSAVLAKEKNKPKPKLKGKGGPVQPNDIENYVTAVVGADYMSTNSMKTQTDIKEAASAIAAALAPELAVKMQQMEASHVTSGQGKADVTVKHPDGSEHTAIELVGKSKLFSSVPCEVGFAAGQTLNMGNYQSARIDVSVKIPCAHAELGQVYDFAKKWVDDRLIKLMQDFTLVTK